MATIEKNGSTYRVRQFVGGKYKTVAKADTKAEALRLQSRIEEEERAKSSVIYGTQLPLGELLSRWRLAKLSAGNDPLHTAASEKRVRTVCDARGWHGTASVTALEVSQYRQAGGCARTCSLLGGILRWSADTLDQRIDPKALVALRAGRAGRRPSPDLVSAKRVAELEAKAQGMSDSAAALVHCLSTYGWRPITAARLVVRDFDAVAGAITCQVKGGDVVRHLLLADTVDRLRRRVANAGPTEPLFLDPRTGNGWRIIGGISRWSQDHLRIKIYDLKRYAISTMLNRGIPPHDIAAFTGHRTVSQVLKYSRSNEDRQRMALGALGKSLGTDANGTQQLTGGNA